MDRPNKYFGTHEFLKREEKIKRGSNRNFGFTFAAIFALIGLSGWYSGKYLWPWWLGSATLFGLAALVIPGILTPLNLAWTRLGLLLSAITSPVMLAILFYLCIAPVGLLLRLARKDILNLRWSSDARTYWIDRPASSSFSDQF